MAVEKKNKRNGNLRMECRVTSNGHEDAIKLVCVIFVYTNCIQHGKGRGTCLSAIIKLLRKKKMAHCNSHQIKDVKMFVILF